MWSTPSIPLLPGQLESMVVVPFRVLSMKNFELFNHLLKIIITYNLNLQLNANYLNHIVM